MDPSDVMVPADVPDELIDTYVENYLNATAGTGSMNLFACDQKIEHLNDDFYGEGIPLTSNDPAHLFEIGDLSFAEGTLGVLAGQLGLIAQYARDAPDLPYLVKLNSKTNLVKTAQRDPVSMAMWDMDDVMSLVHNGINVVGIGYTVYLGSEHEHEMLTEAATFIRQAHELGMLSVVWMYPRGQAVADEKDPQLIAGAAGVAARRAPADTPRQRAHRRRLEPRGQRPPRAGPARVALGGRARGRRRAVERATRRA